MKHWGAALTTYPTFIESIRNLMDSIQDLSSTMTYYQTHFELQLM